MEHNKRFHFGICEWSVHARGAELCRMAARNGLDRIQLGVGTETFLGGGLAAMAVRETYRQAAAESGVQICSLAPQFVDQYSFTHPAGEEEAQIALTLCERTIDLCAEFGCTSYLLPVLCKNGIEDGESFHRAAAHIRYLAGRAAQSGIRTLLEINLRAEEVLDLLDAVDHPMVGLYFDSQNLYAQCGASMARWFKALRPWIGGVHIKDGVGGMLSGTLIGEGTSGFEKTAQAIVSSDYAGDILIESVYEKPTVCAMGTEEALLAKDAATLRRVFET